MTTTPLWRLFLVITATAAAATTALAAITRYTVAIGALYAANRATNLFQAISTIYYLLSQKKSNFNKLNFNSEFLYNLNSNFLTKYYNFVM